MFYGLTSRSSTLGRVFAEIRVDFLHPIDWESETAAVASSR